MKVVLGHSQVTTEAWKTRPSSRGLLSLIIVVSVTLGALHSMAEDEIDAGHTAAGKLKVNHSFSVLPLEASVFPGIIGYATGEVGFHSVAFDEPGDDFFQLSSEGDFRLVLLAKDPGMEVWNDHGSGFMSIGESFFVGSAPFDTHPIWNIVDGTPGQTYSLTLKLQDLNGVYAESDPFQLSFTPNPPVLAITNAGHGLIAISWSPDTSGFVLQSTTGIAPFAWTNAPSGSTNPVTLPAAEPPTLYRLKN